MIWVNGALVEEGSLVAGADDRGLLLGDGLFETIKISQGKAVFLKDHLCRLVSSARMFDLPVSRERLEAGLADLIANTDPLLSGSARITVLRGSGPRGIAPIPVSHQSPLSVITLGKGRSSPSEGPHPVILSPFHRSSTAPTSHHKTTSYTDNIYARAVATRAGAADAVFENEHRHISSTSMANIFLDLGSEIVTPPLSSGILPGITRKKILSMARLCQVPIKVRQFTSADLLGRWIYRTNSLIGVDCVYLRDRVGQEPTIPPRDKLLRALLDDAERNERER